MSFCLMFGEWEFSAGEFQFTIYDDKNEIFSLFIDCELKYFYTFVMIKITYQQNQYHPYQINETIRIRN